MTSEGLNLPIPPELVDAVFARVQQQLRASEKPTTRLLTVDEIAERYSLSKFEVYERTRLNQIPLIQHPGRRRVYSPEAWLDAYDAGAFELEVRTIKTPEGIGRVVRPKGTT